MSAVIEADIVRVLCRHLEGTPLPAGVAIAWPGIDNDPNGAPYLRVTIAKNTPINVHIGGGREPVRRGFLLVTVLWPKREGLIPPSELAGLIRQRFAFGTVLPGAGFTVRIVEEPRVAGDDQGAVYLEVPVVIPWHAFPA